MFTFNLRGEGPDMSPLNRQQTSGLVGFSISELKSLFVSWLQVNKLAHNSISETLAEMKLIQGSAEHVTNEFRNQVVQQIIEDKSLTQEEQQNMINIIHSFNRATFESCIFQLTLVRQEHMKKQDDLHGVSEKVFELISIDMEKKSQQLNQIANELDQKAEKMRLISQRAHENLHKSRVSLLQLQLNSNLRRQKDCQDGGILELLQLEERKLIEEMASLCASTLP